MKNSMAQRDDWLFVLVDDDPHSAKFFRRRMAEVAQDKVNLNLDWFESPTRALSAIQNFKSDTQNPFSQGVPDMFVLDLKYSSSANLDFMESAMPSLKSANIPLVVFLPNNNELSRSTHMNAGAQDCFIRQSELPRYDAELTRILALTRRVSNTA